MDGHPAQDILTVDYEDWFHVLEPGWTDPHLWKALPLHAERDTLALLDVLDRSGARATFFVTGWLAVRTPDTVREIARRGHAIASHGYLHVPPETMSEPEFLRDLDRSVAALDHLGTGPVRGYRAPGFGIRCCRFPYRDILRRRGFAYDASRFPGLYPGRGGTAGPLGPTSAGAQGEEFWDVPVSAVRLLGVPVAFSGGGFLRLMPGWLVRLGVSRLRAAGRPAVLYVHPRDLNPASPRIPAPPWDRWRYYGGRRGMARKLDALLCAREFVSIEEFLGLDGREAAS